MENGCFRVLIVEDDSTLRRLVALRLSRMGLICSTAESVSEAEKLANNSKFDLFILDYHLPAGLSGLTFYRSVRDQGLHIPAVMVTEFGNEKVITQALRLGIRDFLPKNHDFLDNLGLAVERLIQSIKDEKKLLQMQTERVALEATLAAFDAAGIGSLVWNSLKKPGLFVSAQLYQLLEVKPGSLKTIADFIALIYRDDRRRVVHLLRQARDNATDSECEFRLTSGAASKRWMRAKISFKLQEGGKGFQLLATIWDETEKHRQQKELKRMHAKLGKLAKRLQLSMLEIHHRVKNSFQTVMSFLNMELRQKDSLSHDDVARIVSYVRGLSLIHDMLAERAKEFPGDSHMDVVSLIQSICACFSVNNSTIKLEESHESLIVLPRVASSLAVISTELLINALKHGDQGELNLHLYAVDSEHARFSIENRFNTNNKQSSVLENGHFTHGSSGMGSELIDFLARTDLQTEIQREFTADNCYRVTVSFPIVASALLDLASAA